MDLPDRYQLTPTANRELARQHLTLLIHTEARFEGVTTTWAQTEAIMAGRVIDGVPANDVNVIQLLQAGWQELLGSPAPASLELAQKLNAIVARDDALAPGDFRTGQGSVTLPNGDEVVPPAVDLAQEQAFWDRVVNDPERSATDKALTVIFHCMRGQLFWDGNKRTATLLANKLMIDHGVGLINVPLDRWSEWHRLIADYYRTGEMETLKRWTYENGILGE